MIAIVHIYSIQIIEFQVWNRILMPLEIKALADCQSNEQVLFGLGLEVFHKMFLIPPAGQESIYRTVFTKGR